MITIPPIPDSAHFLPKTHLDNSYINYWKAERYKALEIARTEDSLFFFLQWFKGASNKRKIVLWVPDYFCDDTLMKLKVLDYIDLIYYPVNKNFEPQWEQCESLAAECAPDVYLAVHYFGKCCDISRALVWCQKYHALLIEDCAHVLLPVGKMGTSGDIVLFSMHKLLAIPSGAMFLYDPEKLKNYLLNNDVEEQLNSLHLSLKKEKNNVIWIMKRMIQKLHLFTSSIKKLDILEVGEDAKSDREPLKVSNLSKGLLEKYSIEELRKIAAIRERNLAILNHIMLQSYGVVPVIKEGVPYLGLYQYVPEDFNSVNKLLQNKLLVQKWPVMSREVISNGNMKHQQAVELASSTFTLPVHQSIRRQELISKYDKENRYNGSTFILLKNCDSFSEWSEIFLKIPYSTLTQDWYYGEAKCQKEGWSVHRKIIYHTDTPIGIVQILEKKIGGIKIIRINRGPLFMPEYKTIENITAVTQLLKSYERSVRPHVLLWNPELEDSFPFLKLMTQFKMIEWKKTPYQSGWLHLKLQSSEVFEGLKSKWRNQLKSSLKKGVIIREYEGELNPLLALYIDNMEKKKFKGISPDLLEKIYELHPETFLILGAYLDECLIAYDIAYIHGNSMTYLIGWNDEAGRNYYANNNLLYSMTEYGANRNIKYFDLGGMDTILTPEIARFKGGMNPEVYALLGEFYSI